MTTISQSSYNAEKDCLICLLRLGIGHQSGEVPQNVDWEKVLALIKRNQLSAICCDGIFALEEKGKLSQIDSMDRKLKRRLVGLSFNYEKKYKEYVARLISLAAFCNSRDLKIMVLKGYGLSLNYPKPDHRPCGDVDIWMFGRYKELDNALQKELGIGINNRDHHHTSFSWKGLKVENHYDIVNVYSHRGSRVLEKVFKELAMDDTCRAEVEGQRLYFPSPDFHTLFQVSHAMGHFAAEEITLRMILDWALFVSKHEKEINWERLLAILKEYHMIDFFAIMNSICVEDLGFDASLFPLLSSDKEMKGKVLDEIINPSFSLKKPSGLFPRILFKYKRWQANAWKQKLCYPENRISLFFRSVWSHILKPKNI